jgi:hypothetical protein
MTAPEAATPRPIPPPSAPPPLPPSQSLSPSGGAPTPPDVESTRSPGGSKTGLPHLPPNVAVLDDERAADWEAPDAGTPNTEVQR